LSGYGFEYVVLAFFFGLATGVVGKIKGSSFVIWFIVGAVVPVFGLIAAIVSRWENAELRRRCEECGAVVPITDQVCKRCGRDLDFPSEAIAPRIGSAR
jgi:hypothetical protein